MMQGKQKQFKTEIDKDFKKKIKPIKVQCIRVSAIHREERQKLLSTQRQKREALALEQSKRFRSGLTGIWDWFSGQKKKITEKNEIEIQKVEQRDRQDYQSLIQHQRKKRAWLQDKIDKLKDRYEKQLLDIGVCLEMEQYIEMNHEISKTSYSIKYEHEFSFE
ncbi:MAG: hypothetical protein AAF228_05405 [Pseudomonadota bacterium]